MGKESLKVRWWTICRTAYELASILPQFKKCKSFTGWGLDLHDLSTVPWLRVGISRHTNFFYENLAKLLAIGHCTNRSKHAINEEFFLLWPLLLYVLWKTPWNRWRAGKKSENPSLLRANEFVAPAAPPDFASKQRVNEVRQIEERREEGE